MLVSVSTSMFCGKMLNVDFMSFKTPLATPQAHTIESVLAKRALFLLTKWEPNRSDMQVAGVCFQPFPGKGNFESYYVLRVN